jgi:membrane protein DedA with SNARE-associated domain
MQTIEFFIGWCIDHLNYWTITLFMAIESSFLPLPAEIVIPPAAYESAQTHYMNPILIVVFGTTGSIIGSLINYKLAQWLGRPIIYKFANSRIGHAFFLSQERMEHAEDYFKGHGAISIFIGRLVPGVRHLISIPAGLSKMKMSHFLLYTILGAGLWNSILTGMGYYLQHLIPKSQLYDTVKRYSHEVGLFFLIIAVILIGYAIIKRQLKKRKNKQAQ